MSNVGLLYVGAVLLVNGFMLLGKIDGKSAGIFNLFVGGLQIFTPIFMITTANGDAQTILSASAIFLFGFTYLYVGITNLTNASGSGVGYYSLWVSILAIGYSLVNFINFGDVKFGIIWLMWAFLWFLFYLLLAKNKPIEKYTGWIAVIQSWITCTIPAFSILAGIWDAVTNVAGIIIGIGAFIIFALLYKMLPTFINEKRVDQLDA
ncbi:AmiS/UreI family transporter [Bacillus sp. REN16]|uniref:AmiS/UreI family transporter n=1 Tax=Bacillus sp. REN16 TaxID=2887296 RepID=UPI001E40A364|nr:AmiS/UreI family transporter [Bacillus sp. REN16]MCC3358207.1 AmiS/UreI family transporter [Bacillus sp. REN16]